MAIATEAVVDRRSSASPRPPRALLLAAVLAASVASAPIWYLLIRAASVGLDRVADIMARPGFAAAAGSSLAMTVVVGVLATVLGTATAWLVGRTALPARRAWAVALVLPLAVPSYVAAYSWVSLFPGMRGFWAAVLVMTLASAPLVVLPVLAALRSAEASLEEVARSLGAGRWQVFRTVTLPAVWPAAAAGGLLVMLYTLSEFGTYSVFRVDSLTRAVMLSFGSAFDRSTAVVQSLALVAMALLLVVAERRVRGRAQRWAVLTGTPRTVAPLRLRPALAALGTALLLALTLLAIGVPALALTLRLLSSVRGGFDPPALLQAAVATSWVAMLGAVLAVLLAVPVAYLSARYPGGPSRVLETAAYSGHALPGVVVGLAMVFLTLNLVPALYQSLLALALAYAVLFLPKAIGSARTAIAAVPPGLEQLARSQGRGPLRAFAGVTGRLASPGILVGGLLVMVTAMKELPATLMLRPTGTETLATRMWSATEIAAYGTAAPYAAALVLVACVPTLLLARGLLANERQDA